MSTTDQEEWRRTSPLAVIFFLGKIYQAIAQHAVQTFAPLVAFLVAYQGDLKDKVIIALVGFIIVTVSGALLRYWFFRYRIGDDSVLIREGVIQKTQVDIKFDRVQAVSTQQNVIFRAFGLVTVKLDTAGSAKQEGNLPAVAEELANSLKERVRLVRPSRRSGSDLTDETETDTEAPADARKLLSLNNKDMVRIGLSSNRALIFLAFLGPLIEPIGNQMDEVVDKEAVVAVAEGAREAVISGFQLGLLIVLGILLFLVIATIVGAFLRYYQFQLSADDGGFRSTAGLLTHHEHSINRVKIQTLAVIQNIMLRFFKRYRVRAKQASSGKQKLANSFVIPLAERDQLSMLANETFGDEFPDVVLDPTSTTFRPIAKHYIRSRVILTGVLPAVAYTTLMVLPFGAIAMVFLLWIPLNALIFWRLHKRFGVVVTPHGIVRRRGFLGFQVSAFLHRKVQRINLTQTPSQRRKGLASLRFYLASGSIKVPYVDAEKARQLRDYVLYQVESSQKAWH